MQKYIGTKLVEAVPVYYNGTEGYAVFYPDGHQSWSPKEVFEKAYLPLKHNELLREPTAPSIGHEMVKDFIVSTEVRTMGGKTTVVRAVLRNGFEIVESSSCVSPENYDEELGAEVCMGKIEDKVWMLLGFLLQTAAHGIKGDTTHLATQKQTSGARADA